MPSTCTIYPKRFLLISCFLLPVFADAQQCTNPGQTPETAFLVCGSDAYVMNTPEFCGLQPVPAPCPAGYTYENTNPHFFRMNCFTSGTLGFIIAPDEAVANYDWQLFDITSTNPNDIFTNPALFVACNWSAEPGTTGASVDGTNLIICGGPGGALFSKMPVVTAGRSYLLMVSDKSFSLQGYSISFTGGNASITDLEEPALYRALTGCSSTTVTVRLNKKILCTSIASNGSDFLISNGAAIVSAYPSDCSSALGTDSIILTLAQPLPFGNYTLTLTTGNDGNTLMDVCQREIPDGANLPLVSAPPLPTPMDSLVKSGCSPSYVELVFRKPIGCSSIAPDASDFIITGPQPVTYFVNGNACATDNLTPIIRINFIAPLSTAGTYTIELVAGTDGNTLLDECGFPVQSGSTLSFTLDEPISSVFTYIAPPSCTVSTVSFFHNGNGNANAWNWDFGDGSTSDLQNPVKIYQSPGQYSIRLSVSNVKCTDSSSQQLTIGGFLQAAFDAPAMVCPGDTVRFVNKSSNSFDTWQWDFGNGQSSSLKDPPLVRYADIQRESYYSVKLLASSSTLGCQYSFSRVIKALSNCLIAVPSAFTPNGDGKNDYLFPLNALKADDLLFRVFNRTGQLVFETRDWTKKWDGRINGQLQRTGVYAWMLSFIHRGSRERTFLKGTTLLLR